jgi:hypothetical protein
VLKLKAMRMQILQRIAGRTVRKGNVVMTYQEFKIC